MDGSLNEAERPVTAPESRPVSLSVVIDGRLDDTRAYQVASFTDRLGLAGIWLRCPRLPQGGTPVNETYIAGLLSSLASGVSVASGLLLDADAADPGESNAAWLDYLPPRPVSPAAGLPPSPRIALAGSPPAITRWLDLIARRPGLAVPRLALPPGTRDGSSTAVFVPCVPGRDLAAAVPAAAAAARGRPVLAEVTVSVGRTAAEARARADADELFTRAGHPAEQGLFGTLEECQAAAARLAQAGATELVCHLPLASDLPDVLAQLRSIAIGAEVLRRGEPPSAAPPPPDGWGGRRLTG